MAHMKLTVIGCSPAWPNPGGAQSGYLVQGPPGRVLLDCGAGVLAKLREHEDWPQIDAICITHFHLDHWGDLVPWVWAQSFGPASELPEPELWLPPGGRKILSEIGGRLGFPDMFENAFRASEYADGEAFETAGMRVTPRKVLHYDLLAFGFRVSANGKSLAYSGDSGPNGSLAELARDADLFLCEATLDQPYPEGGTRGHLAAVEADAAFQASGARRLLLTHRPKERDLEPQFEQVHDGFEVDV
jgi:ribonuclease BN (tRNA processing enzyme)